MTHILLFGASGFLGAHVRGALAQQPSVERISCPGRGQCDLITAGVDEIINLLRALRPTAVVNCTGRLDGTLSELVLANTLTTAKILDALTAVNSTARFVRLGSAGEYGPVPHGHAVTEADPAKPASGYGLSHLSATCLVDIAAAADRVDGITLRVFNPIGAGIGETTLLGRAAVRLLHAVAVAQPTITMGPLSAYRDFVDARDVAAAVVAATLAPRLNHRVLNVGSGRALTARTAVSVLAETAGFTGEIREEGAATARSATVDWMLADTSRASEMLGWNPAYDLTDSAKAILASLDAR
jgi:nucleoside-diphosphate-sugar epimerase